MKAVNKNIKLFFANILECKLKICIGFIVLFLIGYYFFYHELKYYGNNKIIKSDKKPLLINHMGYGNEAPISSILATKRSLDSGSTILDSDVWLTKDSKVVVFHDKDLSKNTDGEGLIYEHNLSDLNKLIIQENKFKIKENIESLEKHILEAELYKDTLFFIEIKEIETERFDVVLNEIILLSEYYDIKSRVIVFNRDPFKVCTVNNKDMLSGFNFVDEGYYDKVLHKYGESSLMENSYFKLPFYKRSIFLQRAVRKFCQPDIMAINKDVDEDVYLKIKKAGYQFVVWSANTKEDMGKAVSEKAEGIVTDKPKLLVDFLYKINLKSEI